MRKTVLIAGVMLTTLSACGGEREASNQSEAPVSEAREEAGPEAAAELATMDEGLRNGVFIRAIRDAGRDCQGVESSSQGGQHEGAPVWTARCVGGEQYAIVIAESGVAQVLTDAEAQAAGVSVGAAGNMSSGNMASDNMSAGNMQ